MASGRLWQLVEAAEELLAFGAHEGPCTERPTCQSCGQVIGGCAEHAVAFAARREKLDRALEDAREALLLKGDPSADGPAGVLLGPGTGAAS